MLTKVTGKGGISAKVILHSKKAFKGQHIVTFELEYPRFIHSELMTHRLFSRNAASSRAIPVSKMLEQVRDKPAKPIHWGMNQAGMQADKECNNVVQMMDYYEGDDEGNVGGWHKTKFSRIGAWYAAAEQACKVAEAMSEAGYHKQITNRLLEPFQMMKTVVTATEFDNFFHLRCHKDAQPEIRELANLMYECYVNSEAQTLRAGEWHLPYVGVSRNDQGSIQYHIASLDGEIFLTLEEAKKVSASCCAQVSYRALDDSLEKAVKIFDKLINSKPCHASPVEHQATPLISVSPMDSLRRIPGVTHMDCKNNLWSGNFKGWIQYRQLFKDHTNWDYEPGDSDG